MLLGGMGGAWPVDDDDVTGGVVMPMLVELRWGRPFMVLLLPWKCEAALVLGCCLEELSCLFESSCEAELWPLVT